MTALIGAPVFASKPYFLDADPVYLENITGYIEDGFDVEEYRDLYDTVIDVETVTGASFRAHQRLQINVLAEPAEGLADFDGIRTFYMPLLMVDEWLEVPTRLTDKYKGRWHPTRQLCRQRVLEEDPPPWQHRAPDAGLRAPGSGLSLSDGDVC